MKKLNMLNEAKRLHVLGFAIHFLRPRSKVPVDSGWGTGPRKLWDPLNEQYRENMNVGVRLGTPSKIGDKGYLTVIDVDVKSEDPRHREEALDHVNLIIGDYSTLPEVSSGRGNGSAHFYCLTSEPFKTFTPHRSKEKIKVLMPSKKPSQKELEALSEAEIMEGYRLSPAWEISLYSEGRQVVLPPSVHPDTGRIYEWVLPIEDESDLPLINLNIEKSVEKDGENSTKPVDAAPPIDGVEFETVDLGWVDIPDAIKEGIRLGSGVEDRSSFLFTASSALYNAGLSRDEILSALTEPNNFISSCAFDHAKTKSRKRAAEWLWKYTVHKVFKERDAQAIFESMAEIVPNRVLTEEEAIKQTEEIKAEDTWEQELERDKYRNIKCLLRNVELILRNDVGQEVFRRDVFAFKDSYGVDTPWGGKCGNRIIDDDVPRIKLWISRKYKIEPKDGMINDAITTIAVRNAYDPVVERLDKLPEWDGVSRLGSWLKNNFGAEGDPIYLDQVFTKWIVAMVKRVYQPGFKFDWMPIFEGLQGVGKSSFGRMLVGNEYFLDWLPKLSDKDAALGLQGHWCVEMGELSHFRATELDDIKSFLTRTTDKFRPPHGRKLIESQRRCVFFGTTNRGKYLKDDTGNRRFKPVIVGKLNFDKLKKEKTQLFAEAKYLLNSRIWGEEDFELDKEAKVYEALIHQEKLVEDESFVMRELMSIFIEKVEKGDVEFNFKKFRISDLFLPGMAFHSKYPPNVRNMQFVAKALKSFGGERRKIMGNHYWKIEVGEDF